MSAARRERKVVTVLFADLVGFTSRAESLDPEDVEAILRPYHQRLRDELERHGGTVEKFIGDAVMALFGAPVAHEDDPERAVRAALAIREWAEEAGDLEVRIGITTGEALVSLDARPEAGEGMASGDVVNTAARLQAAAPTNGILVDETTYRATERAISFEEADAVEAKGKSEPVSVWKTMEARGRFGVDVQQEARTPLVGRREEVDALIGALARVRKERAPQLVTLVGVPGIGKSRLVYELFQIVESESDLVTWRQGRSLPYGEGVSFWALAEMVKGEAGILETDSADQAGTKLREATEAVVVEPGEARWVETHLRPLVGLGGDGELGGEGQSEAFAAWRRFLEALAERRPFVVVFEDLHWADDGLLEFVDHLVEWVTDVPLLVLCTARPELLARRPGWGGGKPNAVTLSLFALTGDETAHLVHGLLERAVLPAALQTTLLERAGGNPLYAEEFARMLADRGSLEEGELPESLQGIIAARLDALSAEEKALVQDAAVMGKVFWPGALAALGGRESRALTEMLHILERRQFVRRERRSSVAGQTQHVFLHLLVRDVAYGQIPRAQRAEKHRLAAEWIESLGSDRSEDRAEMLAHHYLSALEFAGAAGLDTSALAAPSRAAFRDAGDRALALNAFTAARRFYAAALDLVSQDDPARPYLVWKLVQADAVVRESDLDALGEAVAGFLAASDTEAAAEVEAYIGITLWNRGLRGDADEHLERAFALVEDAPLSPQKVRVLAERSRFRMWSGDNEGAVRAGREVLVMAEELGLDDVRASLLNNIGTSRVVLGDEGGFSDLEQSLAIGLEHSLAQHLHRTYHNLMESYRAVGRLVESAEVLAEERISDERFGLERQLRWVMGEEAVDRYWRGDWKTALALSNEFIAEVENGSPHYMESGCRFVRASIRLACGDEPGADEDSARGLDLGREQKDLQAFAPMLALRARILLALGATVEAAGLVDEVLAQPLHYASVVDLAWALTDLQRTDELLSRADEPGPTRWLETALAIAGGRIESAADILAEMGNVADEAYARLRSGRDHEIRRALEFYRSVGATRFIEQGESMLAATA